MEESPEELASIKKNKHDVHILIIGGGQGGMAILDVFRGYQEWLYIDGIVDIKPDAPAMCAARAYHIPTHTDSKTTVQQFDGDIIVDVTGDKHVTKDIKTWRQNEHIEIIANNSARLVFDLVCRQRSDENKIHTQDLRLQLLDCMLDISLRLEQHKNTTEILEQAIKSMHSCLMARKSLALILEDNRCQCFGIIDRKIPKYLPHGFAAELHHQFYDFEKRDILHRHFEYLDTPIHVPIIDDDFDLVIPLFKHSTLIAVLLIQSKGQISEQTSTMLTMAASHLRLTIEAYESHQQLEAQAINDVLTDSYNRRYFEIRLEQEVARIKRLAQGQLSCMFFDLDNFKPINDTYGHHIGDAVLKSIAVTINHTLRGYDIFARYGGDEFVALLPFDKNASHHTAYDIASRILKNVQNIQIEICPDLQLSLSIGLVTLTSEQLTTGKALVQLADQALYQAKREKGKGCVHAITPNKALTN